MRISVIAPNFYLKRRECFNRKALVFVSGIRSWFSRPSFTVRVFYCLLYLTILKNKCPAVYEVRFNVKMNSSKMESDRNKTPLRCQFNLTY